MRNRIWSITFLLAATGCGQANDGSNARQEGDVDKATLPEDAGVARDIEEGCGLDTGYDGDDTCILPPEPGTGDQFHYGPRDYDDPDEVAKYVLEPGQEVLDCQYVDANNEQEVYYRDFTNSLRPGSHHMIVNELEEDIEDGFRECERLGAAGAPRLMGGTTVARGERTSDEAAPENEGLANRLGARAQVEMQLHYFNTSEEPLLREAWMNIHYKDASEVTELTEPVQGYGNVAMAIPVGAHETWRSRMTAPEDVRLVDVYSHFHANTVRMSAWLVRENGERTLIYETYDWEEPGVLPLNSVQENPTPDPELGRMGGYSGILEIEAGDALEWECEVINNRDVELTWANKALDAEMCNLRGNYAPSFGSQWLQWTAGWKCSEEEPCPR